MAITALPAATKPPLLPGHRRRATGVTAVERVPAPDISNFARGDDLRERAKRAGVLYEAGVHRHFAPQFPGYVAGPWFRFSDARERNRLAQIDAVVFPALEPTAAQEREASACITAADATVLLIEVKYTHCVEAWAQLREFYEPILRAYLPGARIVLVEICKTFFPNIRWPEPAHWCDTLADALELPDGALAITQLLKVPRR